MPQSRQRTVVVIASPSVAIELHNQMVFRHLAGLTIAACLLCAIEALAQQASAPAGSGKPDACELMPRSDLEARFPGMEVGGKQPNLSPLFQGLPQYNQSCMYSVKLPSPTSKMFFAHIISLGVIGCDLCNTKSPTTSTATETLARMRDTQEKLAANPSFHLKVTSLPGVGDDAFEVTSDTGYKIYARKDDLVYLLTLDKYSEQTQANAVALAAQVARRWRGGVGMVQADTPIAANKGVEQPPDTRVVVTAPADKWPDACAFLTHADVRAIFGDMTIDWQPHRTMGKLEFQSRINRVETLPHPIGCSYTAEKPAMVNGRREPIAYIIDVHIADVSTTAEYAKKRYEFLYRNDTPLPGLGDEAGFDKTNEMINIRKGALTLWVQVTDDDRDQARHADTLRRQEKLAKLVAARMP